VPAEAGVAVNAKKARATVNTKKARAKAARLFMLETMVVNSGKWLLDINHDYHHRCYNSTYRYLSYSDLKKCFSGLKSK
jgi:hypothetical protein